MTKLRYLIISLLVVWAAGCKKENNNNNNNNTQLTCTPATVTHSNVKSREYQYDNSGKLERVNLYSETGRMQFYYAIKYDGSGNISEVTLSDTSGMGRSVYTPSYNSDGTISKVVRQDVGAGTDNFTNTYTYSGGRLDKITESFNGAEQDFKKYDYDAAGNVSTITTYISNPGGTPDLIQTEEIVYDDKKAVPTKFDLILNPASAKHNILSYTVKDNSNVVDINQSYAATYTYNSDNLPQSVHIAYQDGTVKDYELAYNCK
jgi:hypothetical protein